MAQPTSDLDLLILTNDLSEWTAQAEWLAELIRRFSLPYLGAVLGSHGVAKSWRAWLGQNVGLEMTFTDLSWANVSPIDPGTHQIVSDGIQSLVDKDGLLQSASEAV